MTERNKSDTIYYTHCSKTLLCFTTPSLRLATQIHFCLQAVYDMGTHFDSWTDETLVPKAKMMTECWYTEPQWSKTKSGPTSLQLEALDGHSRNAEL